jgi:hypothetical protein
MSRKSSILGQITAETRVSLRQTCIHHSNDPPTEIAGSLNYMYGVQLFHTEMEVNELLLTEVSRLCQWSSHSHEISF